MEFENSERTWLDREGFLDQLNEKRQLKIINDELAEQLISFEKNGYIVIRNAIDSEAIDAFWEEYKRAWNYKIPLKIRIAGQAPKTICDIVESDSLKQFRVMRAETLCPALADITLASRVQNFFQALFDDAVVCMQTLTYETSSQQGAHADYPYVKSSKLGHMAAAWCAFEHVDRQNGTLFYYPGSHKLPKFDWGDGKLDVDLNRPDIDKKTAEFEEYLRQKTVEHNIDPVYLEAEKGDVLIWHAALVHGGSAYIDQWSRKSVVAHYSSLSSYPFDRPMPNNEMVEHNGGYYFEHPKRSEIWARLGAKTAQLA